MIGVFSGTFDPFTLGHMWIVNQALSQFDELYVLIGMHPKKKCLLSLEERFLLIKSCYSDNPKVKVDVLKFGLSHYIEKNFEDKLKIRLIRGVRGLDDVENESKIADYQRKNNLETVIYNSPKDLLFVSSSNVKELKKLEDWDGLKKLVPSVVFDYLFDLRKTHSKEIFDEHDLLSKSFFKLLKNNIISLKETIDKDQVESMLDPFPYSLAVSDFYHLKEVKIDDIEPDGPKYIKRSCSLGPIIVDYNESNPDFGDLIIIEGKHRWFDACKRGDKTIMAWVGDKAIKYLS